MWYPYAKRIMACSELLVSHAIIYTSTKRLILGMHGDYKSHIGDEDGKDTWPSNVPKFGVGTHSW